MEMKYYNPSNHFKAPIPREPKPYAPPSYQQREVLVPQPATIVLDKESNGAAFKEQRSQTPEKAELPVAVRADSGQRKVKQLNQDDWLILGVLLLLLLSGCEDYILLLVLGYLVIEFHRGG